MNNCIIDFEVNTGASDNFIEKSTWNLLGKPKLLCKKHKFQSVTLDDIPILGTDHIKFFCKL